MTFPAFKLFAAAFINDDAIGCMYMWLVLFLLPHKIGELNWPPVPASGRRWVYAVACITLTTGSRLA